MEKQECYHVKRLHKQGIPASGSSIATVIDVKEEDALAYALEDTFRLLAKLVNNPEIVNHRYTHGFTP